MPARLHSKGKRISLFVERQISNGADLFPVMGQHGSAHELGGKFSGLQAGLARSLRTSERYVAQKRKKQNDSGKLSQHGALIRGYLVPIAEPTSRNFCS
jgi:hypothetical protein